MAVLAIPMSCGVSAYIDENDRHLLQFRYTMNSAGHPFRMAGRRKRYLARDVLGLGDDSPLRVGHFDGDPTNATRQNLHILLGGRLCRSAIRAGGVRRRTYGDRYFVAVGGRWLGMSDFDTAGEAMAAYEVAVAKLRARPSR